MTMTMDRPRTVDELRDHRDELYDELEQLGDKLDDDQWQTIVTRVGELEAQPVAERLRLQMVCSYLAWAGAYPISVGADSSTGRGCHCNGSGWVEPIDAAGKVEPCGSCNPAAYERFKSYNRATGRPHFFCRNPEHCDGCQEAIEIAEQRTQLPV